jgi:post-segregation antitoxin (ccd killing protein)
MPDPEFSMRRRHAGHAAVILHVPRDQSRALLQRGGGHEPISHGDWRPRAVETDPARAYIQEVNTDLIMKATNIRVDEELLRRARRHRINVSEAARQGIAQAIRRRQVQKQLEWLADHRIRGLNRRTDEIIREIRDDE